MSDLIERYPLKADVWFRKSTDEWVLEISGSINDCAISCRHTSPANTSPEDVAGQGHLYNQLEAQQAEIAEYKKQIKQMGSSVRHYEHLAMKFSSQADVYNHDRQRAWAEIDKLRELVKGSYQEGFEDAEHQASNWEIGGHEETWELSLTRKALEQKP